MISALTEFVEADEGIKKALCDSTIEGMDSFFRLRKAEFAFKKQPDMLAKLKEQLANRAEQAKLRANSAIDRLNKSLGEANRVVFSITEWEECFSALKILKIEVSKKHIEIAQIPALWFRCQNEALERVNNLNKTTDVHVDLYCKRTPKGGEEQNK